ncbi:cortactin-binding protein 2-like isoform X2 [Lytechinus variegatus]|uniref:cortactin-binding protein 2-like isoform X2 n=1 Tax=Lytechinus variegatus TaxID=7654 RepID=UPI001BB1A60B|nr:cortactin-binding protein 2-like isoform X2 [Lytechinus variegatus]
MSFPFGARGTGTMKNYSSYTKYRPTTATTGKGASWSGRETSSLPLPSKHQKEKGIMEFSKADLMKLLGLLEAELQARDLVINSLKNERTKLLKPSKNPHRQYTLANPYTALVRDSEKATGKGDSDEEKTKGTDTKDVVASLHAVIEHHRKAEERLKNQVQTLKTSHSKAVNELEDEKRRHAQDTAQGDDVTYMLEKERERLMQQVDFEKAQQSKLEKECKRSQGRLVQERKKHAEFIKLMFDKHLLLAQQLGDTQQRAMEWETQAQAMRAEAQNASKLAAEERNKSVKMEAEMEKKLSDFDIEREQLLGRLQREEMRTKELREELESLKKSSKKSAELVNGRAANGSELNSNSKGSSAKSISSSGDGKTTKGKETPGSVRKPAVAKPKASAKIYGAKGYKTPPHSDKSEASSSSSSSEDINVTVSLSRVHSVSPAAPSPKSNLSESKKPSITSKPKPGTTNLSKGTGKDHKPLSPASSLDKLSGKASSASPSSGVSQKGTKIPSSSAMFANSSQLRKSAPTVAVVAPQPSKASNISQEASKQLPVKKSSDSTDSSKMDKSEPKSNALSRPTTLASGDTAMKAKEPAGKVSQLRNTLTSPKDKDSRDKSPTRGFVGMNVKAAAAQLTSPVGKKVFNPLGNTPNKLNSSTSSEPSGTTQTKEAPTSVSSTAITDKVKPVVTSPSSITPGKRNVSPRGSPPSLTRPTLCPSAWESPLHQAARQGDTATLCRLIEEQHDRTSPEKDGSTLIHAAAYGGQVDSIDLLVTLGEDPDTAQSEGLTPLHVASGEGHEGCVRFLSEHGCNPLSRDSQGWQPIHWAAASGHASCVRTLLDNGSKRDCITNIGWTPFHASARYGQMGSLHALLYHTPTSEQPDLQMLSQINQETAPQPVSPDLLNMMDHDGWTLAHILASTGQKEMLVALHQYGGVHLAVPDRRGRTPCDVASDSCKEFLSSITEGKTVRVIVDVSQSSMPSNDLSPHLLGQKDEASQFVIGQLSVLSGMTWSAFDLAIGSVLANSCKMPESDNELPSPNSDQSPTNEISPENIDIGLGVNSIHSYVAGNLHWSVGETPSMQPHEIFNLTSDIVIKLHGNQNGRLDQLAFETFLPLQMIQTYVRIIKQYKSVLLYGSPGSGKSRLAVKLAQFIQAKNKNDRVESDMTYASLNSSSTHKDLCKLLLSKGFLVQAMSGKPNPSHNKSVHILVLDGLDKVGVAGLFADLLPLIENRSNQKTVRLQALSGTALFTLHENSIIIGTVDGVGPGTDLTVQQHFRWIRVDWDQEPFRSILPRYLFRRLIHEKDGLVPTSPSDDTLRVLTWVCGIWKRLNDALARLSMPEFSTGPKQFFTCCINGDAPMSILKWLCLLWNCSLAPHIEDTFHHNGPTASSAHIQQHNMAASTALYVLLHKAFLPGCPLSDEEADEYFSGFRGISAPTMDVVVEKSSSGAKKPRRSKSLDRSKTSNKAAALARNQAHMDLISADSQRNGRSMIPRRVNPKPLKTVTKQNSLPISSTSKLSESPVITHQRSQSIPSSPTDDPNLLESLLSNHANPSLSEIEQLIELQKTLFGNGGGDGEDKVKNKGMKFSKQTTGGGQVGVVGGQRLLRRASDGAPVSPGLARTRTKDEDGVWSVWEETV